MSNPFGTTTGKLFGQFDNPRSNNTRKTKIDYNKVFSVNPYEISTPDLKKMVERKVRIANKRLLRIERSGYYSYAYNRAMKELQAVGRRRFSYAGKEHGELIKKLYQVEAFLEHQTSTVTQIKKLQERAYDKIANAVKSRTGIDMKQLNLNRNEFYAFLNSKEGKDMVGDYGSEQIQDDIAMALKDRSLKLSDVLEQYKEFMGTHLPLEAVQYRREGKVGSYDEYRRLLEKQKYR